MVTSQKTHPVKTPFWKISEYLGWCIPWCTTFVFHRTFQPTSYEWVGIWIMSVWNNAYHCLDLNIHCHCVLAGKGSPVGAFPSQCGLTGVLLRVHITFVQKLLTALVIFYNFHGCHKNEWLKDQTLTIFIALHVTFATCIFFWCSQWTAQLLIMEYE